MSDPLRADCASCAALCCVAPSLSASSDFAIDKPAGEPCPNLGGGFRCGVHDRLRAEGFPGCAAFDCFGAGQRVTQRAFAGRDWRSEPAIGPQMFAAFHAARALHQGLWLLREALAIPALSGADALRAELVAASERLDAAASGDAASILALDLAALLDPARALLRRASAQARAGLGGADHGGAELIGEDLTGADLRGADLRGALLIVADLVGADLRDADLTSADLRGVDLSGADLSTALFLSQPQLDAACGDAATQLPPGRRRPAHWSV